MFTFYTRLIQRQWRLGAIRLFCIAVAIAVAVTFSITLLGDRIERLFINQSKEVLAADLALQSTTVLTPQQQSIIHDTHLQQAQTLVFRTMASAMDNFLLSSVKAVTDQYPLRGALRVSDVLYGGTKSVHHGPPPGEVWVEDRVLNELGLKTGDSLTIGERSFRITRVIVFEPDRGNNFYSFTPRIMMNRADVESTGIIQPGSRVKYTWLFSGEAATLDKLQKKLVPTLEPNQKFLTIESANRALASTLERAYRFLHVTALVAILLGAVGAALVSYQYANEMTFQYAILRCLGLRGKRLQGAILMPFILFSCVAIIIGLLFGGVVHLLLLHNLGGLIPDNLPPPGPGPFLMSSVTALVVVSGFAWPFLKNLVRTPPKLLLNRFEEQHQPIIFTAIAMTTGLAVLVYAGTREVLISFYVILALCLFVILAYGLTRILIGWITKRSRVGSVSTRLGARMLGANRRIVSLQIIAIAITFFSLALIQTLRDDLVSSWKSKVPDDAPNFFAINLFEADKNSFLDLLRQNNIPHSPLYPVVRGRLTAINGRTVQGEASKETGRRDDAIRRDLALTWSWNLPVDNKIVAGKWHDPAHPPDHATVSVEQRVAKNLDIKAGDLLEFTIDTHKVTAQVTSIRSVEWESFTPNFYMMFNPGALDGLPVTYLVSVYLTHAQRKLLPVFIRTFPNATFFDVDFILNRIRGITRQISHAVETILYFSLFASIVVFIAIEMILRHYRSYSTAIYKAIGTKSGLIQKIFRSQFVFVGLIAGIIAYLLNITVGIIISTWIIEGNYSFNIKTAILCLLITPLLVLVSGYFSLQYTSRTPARKLLAEQ